ncbi:MAG: UvrD-helicase domain-containing protein [Bacteriovoracaceae bacterium]|nr:UvrD-helicase domain-containing protein [Bacteriovoracaceae bacterium]
MSKANTEQLLAIEHSGGVLLKAGAGSGKTFVLVEHIIYLAQKVIDKSQTANAEELEKKLRDYFSKIVLMTFTNKAAGELSIRLTKRFKQKQAEWSGDGFNPWDSAIKMLNYMNVGTIHGFCFKLIKQGHIAGINSASSIISESEFQTKILSLFDSWLVNQKDDFILEIIRANKSAVLESLMEIFMDPGLRLYWSTTKIGNDLSITETLKQINFLEGFEKLFESGSSYLSYNEHEKTSWYKYMEQTSAYMQRGLSSEEDFKLWKSYFEMNPVARAPMKKLGLDAINDYFDKLREFKSLYFKDALEDFETFFANKDKISHWAKTIKSIVDYIEAHYQEIEGITFSDLEYYVLKGLNDKNCQEKLYELYEYFIVDEFQDTSQVQFDILKKIIKNDFNRLFCVGDEKQAIYGFRGGELGVFWDCEKNISKVLMLKNNYRSQPKVIEFNNALFENLFAKGLGFKGQDLMAVKVVYQNIPEGINYSEPGKIRKIKYELELSEETKLSNDDYNFLEAQKIVEHLKEAKHQVVILYKSLKPSQYLINLMMKEGLSFTAQVKIPYSDEPIIGMLYVLAESKFSKREEAIRLKYIGMMLEGYIEILKLKKPENLANIINGFYSNIKNWGVQLSFYQLLQELSISNANYKNNLDVIKGLANNADNLESFYLALKDNAKNRFSMNLQYGNNPEKILIMTAHASKGLEFDEVIMAGLHTNGISKPSNDLIGKWPLSFKWYLHSNQKTAFKTPHFICEKIYQTHKEFAESKRLFYVVGTRAKNEITWIDILAKDVELKQNAKSWIKGLHAFEQDNFGKEILTGIQYISNEPKSFVTVEKSKAQVNISKALFHTNPLGIFSQSNNEQREAKLGLIPQLSVTGLATLAVCPRKFYFKNILKFSKEELAFFETTKVGEAQQSLPMGQKSSSERGTFIHAEIAEAIQRNWVPSRKEFKNKDLNAINWSLEVLSPYRQTHRFISEVQMKFSFFDSMVSGTPDLVLISDNDCQIWDFKTGKPNEEKSLSYWFQLKAYAYATAAQKLVDKNARIKLVLCYVDEQQLFEVNMDYPTLERELYQIWKKVSSPDEKNPLYCSSCEFQNICH